MLTSVLLSAVLGQVPVSLDYGEAGFVISQGEEKSAVTLEDALAPAEFPVESKTLEIEGRTIVLNEKGLGIRSSAGLNFSRVPAIAMTPKIFSQGEIDETFHAVKEGRRTEGFTAVSGIELIERTLYCLLRWEEKDGTPWLEALVSLDLTNEQPGAKLVARMDGISSAVGQVDDRLHFDAGSLVCTSQSADGWGVNRVKLEDSQQEFNLVGPSVSSARLMPGERQFAAGFSKTDYGTTLIYLAVPGGASANPVGEIRGDVRGLFGPEFLEYGRGESTILLNLRTGAELTVQPDAHAHFSDGLVLVWSPAEEPKNAVVYSRDELRPLSFWAAD